MPMLPPDPLFCLRSADMGAVFSICFLRSEHLLAGTMKGSVYLWDLQRNRSSLHFEASTGPINSLLYSSDSLVTQEKGGAIKLWSLDSSRYVLKHSIAADHAAFCRTALHTDINTQDELLFYPRGDNVLAIVNLREIGAGATRLLTPSDVTLPKLGTISCLKPFQKTSELYVLAGYESGHFVTWNATTGSVVSVLQMAENPIAVDFDTQTNRGVVGDPSDKLTIIRYNTETMQLERCSEIAIKNPGTNCIRIRSDRKVFSSGGWDGRIRIFSWKTLRSLAVLTEHKSDGIMDIAYSYDNVGQWKAPIMAAAGKDGQITLWDIYN